jgi:prepilin-type N-terminal cleavage/methylation domain-containing protein
MKPARTLSERMAISPFVVTEGGFGLIEVMIAMVILAFSILGVMGMFQWGDYGLQRGANGTRALAMAEARIEAKRTAPWDSLLADDLDMDGTAEIIMRDDGMQQDAVGGDGIYTASVEHDGIRMIWTVQPDRSGSVSGAGSVVIQARASYQVAGGRWHEIRIGTLRANPKYLGQR